MTAGTISESILSSVKKMLGLPEEYEAFDLDIITHINSIFTILTQIGVGPKDGFMIENKDTLWSDYISDMKLYQLVKSYMLLRVRLIFDPPASSSVLESYKTQINEYECRLRIISETES